MGIGLDVTGKANATEDNTEKAITTQGPQRERGPAPKVLRGGGARASPSGSFRPQLTGAPGEGAPPEPLGKERQGLGRWPYTELAAVVG